VGKTASRDEIAAYLDAYLRVADIPDSSPNGLQVEGRARVARVAYAVDASVATIAAAVRGGADMLVVHHGLWWGKHEQITGNLYRRVAALIRSGLSLYAAHLPLDCHPEVGNNAELARMLSLETVARFGRYRGVEVGVIGEARRAVARGRFVAAVETKLRARADVLPFGPARLRRVAIVSGGGGMLAEEARAAGCDTLLTGETSHAAYHQAREARINVVFAGHYATETVGLKALARHLRRRFGVTGRFVSAPTGY
jgi:dinuclear metal center YbgI/SA1388 family protein